MLTIFGILFLYLKQILIENRNFSGIFAWTSIRKLKSRNLNIKDFDISIFIVLICKIRRTLEKKNNFFAQTWRKIYFFKFKTRFCGHAINICSLYDVIDDFPVRG